MISQKFHPHWIYPTQNRAFTIKITGESPIQHAFDSCNQPLQDRLDQQFPINSQNQLGMALTRGRRVGYRGNSAGHYAATALDTKPPPRGRATKQVVQQTNQAKDNSARPGVKMIDEL